jgi:hypothetical protein
MYLRESSSHLSFYPAIPSKTNPLAKKMPPPPRTAVGRILFSATAWITLEASGTQLPAVFGCLLTAWWVNRIIGLLKQLKSGSGQIFLAAT